MSTKNPNELAVKKLISLLSSSSTSGEIKVAAIQSLGEAGGLEAVQKLISIVNSPSTPVALKQAAVLALGRAGRYSGTEEQPTCIPPHLDN